MKSFDVKRWSEKQQVAAVLLIAAALIALMSHFILLPQTRKRRVLERDIRKMRTQLEQSNLMLGEQALGEHVRNEQDVSNRLREEWLDVVDHLTSGGASSNDAVGHIDFKMALFEVQQRLLRKSRAANIDLPHSLGLKDRVESDENARELMHQLRAVEKLVNLAVDLDIKTVRQVNPLPVRRHTAGPDKKVYMEEYPVRMQFYGDLKNLYGLLHAALERDTCFALRNLQVEAATATSGDMLMIDTVMSALVFVENPEDVIPVKKRVVLLPPRGY